MPCLCSLSPARRRRLREGSTGRRRRRIRLRTTTAAFPAPALVFVLVGALAAAPATVVYAMPAHPDATVGPPRGSGPHSEQFQPKLRGDAFFNYLIEERTGYPVVFDEKSGWTFAVWEDDEEEDTTVSKGQNSEGEGEKVRSLKNHEQSGHELKTRGTRSYIFGSPETTGGVNRGSGHFVSSGVPAANLNGGLSGVGDDELEQVLSTPKLRTESELGDQLANAEEKARAAIFTADDEKRAHALPTLRSFAGSTRAYEYDQYASPEVRNRYRGNFSVFVLLVRFADHADRTLPPREDYEILMNHEGPHQSIVPAGSFRDVYKVNSGGLMNLTAVVTDWITLPYNHSYYAGGQRKFGATKNFTEGIQYAFQQLEDDPNFSFVEAMGDADPAKGGGGYVSSVVFHSGYAAEWGNIDCISEEKYEYRIWSHMRGIPFVSKEPGIEFHQSAIQSGLWSTCGSNIAHVGTVAHEIGHSLGLPDMIGRRPGNGIGAFDMMCNSWGFDGSANYPSLLGAHSKLRLGWLNYTRVTQSGVYAIRASHLSPDALRIDYGFPKNEYLLIENRQPKSFDAKISGANGGGGLAIWHIDDNVGWSSVGGHPWMNIAGVPWPRNRAHYKANLLQADGNYDLERQKNQGQVEDLWRTLPDTIFTHIGMTELGPGGIEPDGGPYPNTDTYQQGKVNRTGVRIEDFSFPGDEMSVTIRLGEDFTARPTMRPTPQPTLLPASLYTFRDVYSLFDVVEIRFINPNVALVDDWIAVYPTNIQELPGGYIPQGVTDWAYTCGTKECTAPSTIAAEGIVSLSIVPSVADATVADWTPGAEYRAYLCRNSEPPYQFLARSNPFRVADVPTTRPTSKPTNVPTTRPLSRPTNVPTAVPSPHPTKAPSTSPTGGPTNVPTTVPSAHPTRAPSTSSSLVTRTPAMIPSQVGDANGSAANENSVPTAGKKSTGAALCVPWSFLLTSLVLVAPFLWM